jgi:hypothetical protein
MARVGQVVETFAATTPSASTVSGVFHPLEAEYAQWKTRQLAQRYVYAEASGTSFTVSYNEEGCKMPILAVVGIAEPGERDVLTFSVGDRENQQAWEDLLQDLKERGVKAIGLWGSRWQQGHAQCQQQEISHLGTPALCRAQDGQRALVCAQQTAGATSTRVESLVLSTGSGKRRSGSGRIC